MPAVVAKARRSYDSDQSVIEERVPSSRRAARSGPMRHSSTARRHTAVHVAVPAPSAPARRRVPQPTPQIPDPLPQQTAPPDLQAQDTYTEAWHEPRQRARGAHRPFRLSWTAGLV
ncbi:MAG: hypothetical protein M3347_16840, partial [Armatimonadota bacterium]|nr:hypothetical protein [Armatimonadota bacterium]